MHFIKLRRPFRTDEWGNTLSCVLYAEDDFTQGDVVRLKKTVGDCVENEPDDETFDEFVERVVETHNEKYGTKFGIVYPAYEVDI